MPSKTRSKPTRLSNSDFSPEEWEELNSAYPDKSNHKFQIRETTTPRDEDEEDEEGTALAIEGLGDDWIVEGSLDGFGGRAILQDENTEEIIAVILTEKCGMHFNYKLLTATPKHPKQKPYRIKIKGQKVYEHAVVKRQNYFLENYDIQEAGQDHVDYRVRGRDVGPLQFKVYDTESHKCCGAVTQKPGDGSWQVSAEDVINPKIMICLTAIASKALG
ncbi:unnamed protein product [Cylindrotheca closterium]|uniref:Uncharacterized protein n=1 Tax=Cylindrotheca closterium TaxID=2856 RepID=A0AAD2FWK7_9STRA|nr:unnamed protein product [Cylindrotheca closterium]